MLEFLQYVMSFILIALLVYSFWVVIKWDRKLNSFLDSHFEMADRKYDRFIFEVCQLRSEAQRFLSDKLKNF